MASASPSPSRTMLTVAPCPWAMALWPRGREEVKWAHTPVGGEIQRDRWMNGQDEQMGSQMMGQMDK